MLASSGLEVMDVYMNLNRYVRPYIHSLPYRPRSTVHVTCSGHATSARAGPHPFYRIVGM